MNMVRHTSWSLEDIARGKETEERFFAAVSEKGWKKPVWFHSVRRANDHEDKVDGHDFFIDTDRGEVAIQVKSSCVGNAEHFAKHPKSSALIVVLRPQHTPDIIRQMITDKITSHRRKQDEKDILTKPPWSVPERGFDG